MCYVDPTSAQFTVKEALTMSQWSTSGAGCTLVGVRAIKAVARIGMTYSRWLNLLGQGLMFISCCYALGSITTF